MDKTRITHSFEETQKVGFEFGQSLHAGDIACLYGDLGSGKTTFVQGLAQGLGIQRRIISPTFIIMRTYEVGSSKKFYHIDLYRTETEHDIKGLGILELLGDQKTIVAIEWPEKMGGLVPKKRVDVYLESLNENERKITFKHVS